MLRLALIAMTALLVASSAADARPHKHRYGRSLCDGFHACRCGTTAARKAGLPYVFNGYNLKRAVEWVRAFPRTSPQAGAVGYVRRGGPSGHVFTVVSYNGGSTATVYDDKGTYERRIDNAIFVSPSSGGYAPRRGSRHVASVAPTGGYDPARVY